MAGDTGEGPGHFGVGSGKGSWGYKVGSLGLVSDHWVGCPWGQWAQEPGDTGMNYWGSWSGGMEGVGMTSMSWGQWGHFHPPLPTPARCQQSPQLQHPPPPPAQQSQGGGPTSSPRVGAKQGGAGSPCHPPSPDRTADTRSCRIAELSPQQISGGLSRGAGWGHLG